jgi:hypothetical protein
MPIKVQGGKTYIQVAERLVLFEELYPDATLSTKVDYMDGRQVIMKAIITQDGKQLSSGHAHAVFGTDSFTDKLVEKAETCAVGRAMALLDTRLRGDEIASADELAVAIKGVSQKDVDARNFDFMQAYLRNAEQIANIKDRLADDDYDHAKELMDEISNEDKLALNRAWTKGGVFTPRETKQIKYWSGDFELLRGEK